VIRLGTILFAVWCAAVVMAFASAANTGYSPFADGGGGRGFYYFGGGGGSSGGPRHK
jgi:uncharacterized membrane protein YgcG